MGNIGGSEITNTVLEFLITDITMDGKMETKIFKVRYIFEYCKIHNCNLY